MKNHKIIKKNFLKILFFRSSFLPFKRKKKIFWCLHNKLPPFPFFIIIPFPLPSNDDDMKISIAHSAAIQQVCIQFSFFFGVGKIVCMFFLFLYRVLLYLEENEKCVCLYKSRGKKWRHCGSIKRTNSTIGYFRITKKKFRFSLNFKKIRLKLNFFLLQHSAIWFLKL